MLKLKADPTFKAKVAIPVPGQKAVEITVEFRHMTREEFQSWANPAEPRGDIETVMQIACGWDGVDAAFSRENVALLLENYHGASWAIGERYGKELNVARLGN